MSEPLFARRAAIFLAGGLVAGFVVVGLLATEDKRNRLAIEVLKEPTAAGEVAVYVMPEKGAYDPSTPILKVAGISYYEDEVVAEADGTMMKEGHDDTGKLPLYRRFRRDVLLVPLYLKLAPEKYLRLSTKPPKKRLEAGEGGEPATPEVSEED